MFTEKTSAKTVSIKMKEINGQTIHIAQMENNEIMIFGLRFSLISTPFSKGFYTVTTTDPKFIDHCLQTGIITAETDFEPGNKLKRIVKFNTALF